MAEISQEAKARVAASQARLAGCSKQKLAKRPYEKDAKGNEDLHLVRRSDNRVFPYTQYLARSPGMDVVGGKMPLSSVPLEVRPQVSDDVASSGDATKVSRADAIMSAVMSVAKEDYAPAAFGRPSMPRVDTIEEITGFNDVSATEIEEAVNALT